MTADDEAVESAMGLVRALDNWMREPESSQTECFSDGFRAGLAHERARQAERLAAAEAVVEAARRVRPCASTSSRGDYLPLVMNGPALDDALEAFDRAKSPQADPEAEPPADPLTSAGYWRARAHAAEAVVEAAKDLMRLKSEPEQIALRRTITAFDRSKSPRDDAAREGETAGRAQYNPARDGEGEK